ncbi:hypothetical protein [Geminocystis herdmanii]|uniref:hypothetical protein n=1 Tax=Geminocystis herdmanii TaxID=669359 RepID=UPI00034D3C87|nr:hypothetical protein [Geminocystis herdmanii]
MSFNLSIYVICGGFNSPILTTNFYHYLTTINNKINLNNTVIFQFDRTAPLRARTPNILPYDGYNIYQYLRKKYQNLSLYNLTFIGFSAGVIGAIIAGNLWKKNGGNVKKLLAFDGWGVPLICDFPCYRISHDYITHLSYLGGEKNAFYCYPSVSHEQLWHNPQNIQGWWQIELGIKTKSTISEFLSSHL